MKKLHQKHSNISHQVDHSAIVRSISHLWNRCELCDCILVSSQQHRFPAHKIVLAAASQYFKVLFLGAGQQMLNSIAKDDQGMDIIQLDVHIDSNSLELVLQAVYRQEFVVSCTVQWMKAQHSAAGCNKTCWMLVCSLRSRLLSGFFPQPHFSR